MTFIEWCLVVIIGFLAGISSYLYTIHSVLLQIRDKK